MNHKGIPLLPLILAILVVPALACGLPTWDEVKPALDLPTAAPTLAPQDLQPTAAPETAPAQTTPNASAYPQVYRGTAQSTAYGASGDASCASRAQVTLAIQDGGKAQVTATGPQFFDHINCTPTDAQITWILEGAADEASATAAFTTCNYGGFVGSGTVSYKDGALSGQLSCTTKEGKKAVTLVLGP